MFREVFGGALQPPNPPLEGRPGVVHALFSCRCARDPARHAWFWSFRQTREKAAYENSAMARDVAALIDHLCLTAVDVVGFSIGAGTAARLLLLHPPQVKSTILAGIGNYVIEETAMEFPKDWPVPRPITVRVWAEEGAERSWSRGESFLDTLPLPISSQLG